MNEVEILALSSLVGSFLSTTATTQLKFSPTRRCPFRPVSDHSEPVGIQVTGWRAASTARRPSPCCGTTAEMAGELS